MKRSPWQWPRPSGRAWALLAFLAPFEAPHLMAQVPTSDSGQGVERRISQEELEAGIAVLSQREELERSLIVLRDIRK
jgi:hypothetical protein